MVYQTGENSKFLLCLPSPSPCHLGVNHYLYFLLLPIQIVFYSSLIPHVHGLEQPRATGVYLQISNARSALLHPHSSSFPPPFLSSSHLDIVLYFPIYNSSFACAVRASSASRYDISQIFNCKDAHAAVAANKACDSISTSGNCPLSPLAPAL